jgi:hypothetical protein
LFVRFPIDHKDTINVNHKPLGDKRKRQREIQTEREKEVFRRYKIFDVAKYLKL